jgi:hypothetical protein
VPLSKANKNPVKICLLDLKGTTGALKMAILFIKVIYLIVKMNILPNPQEICIIVTKFI